MGTECMQQTFSCGAGWRPPHRARSRPSSPTLPRQRLRPAGTTRPPWAPLRLPSSAAPERPIQLGSGSEMSWGCLHPSSAASLAKRCAFPCSQGQEGVALEVICNTSHLSGLWLSNVAAGPGYMFYSERERGKLFEECLLETLLPSGAFGLRGLP